MTLDHIVRRNAQRFPDKPAVAFDDTTLTWQQLDERVNRLCHAFLSRGLQAGDRVAALMGNGIAYLELYFACARTGLIVVPLNYRLNARELAELVEQAQPRAFIYDEGYTSRMGTARDLLSEAFIIFVVGLSRSYERAIKQASDSPVASASGPDDPVAIFFTSGTTGRPKGAVVSHRNLIANAYNQTLADRSVADDINLVATPLYHMGAVFMAVTYTMLGCTQVILPVFKPDAWLTVAAQKKITVSLLIPTMINSILNDDSLGDTELPNLRLLFYGGGPMPPVVLKRAIEAFQCDFTQGYGLTETLEATFLTADDHVLSDNVSVQKRLASAGREAVGADIRIVDDQSNEVPTGEVGEILVRSESVIQEYWQQPEATAETIRNGWFYTGDLGYLDEDRYLFLVDRKKDMIVSGGINIYTKEIEERLYQHADVLEAAVIGLPDDHWGEVVTAVIARRPGATLSDAEVIAHCATELASYKKPRRVEFVSELPKNPSGKILKRELRETLGTQTS